MTTQPLIFLSYAREDELRVAALYDKLSAAGLTPWLDKKDILPGEDWAHTVELALLQAKTILVCLSPNSVRKRGWVQREIRRARDLAEGMLDEDIFLIPVRLEPCDLPKSLEKFQWVDLFETDGETRLIQAIRIGLDRQGIALDPPPASKNPLPNPFFVGGRINDPRHFFDRDRIVREIRAELKKWVSVSLVGESQIGKSSLLYYLYATRAAWLPDVTIEYIDLQGVLDEADFCETVLNQLGERGDTLRHLKRILAGREVILLFDELERLAEQDFNPRLHDLLRSLAQERHFAMGVATQKDLVEVFSTSSSGRTSPFYNIFIIKELNPFSGVEAKKFLVSRLSGTGVTFTEVEIDRLVADSQGHPAKLQGLAKALFDEKVE